MRRIALLLILLSLAPEAFAHTISVLDAADAAARVLGPKLSFAATVTVGKVIPPEPKPRRSEFKYYYREGKTRIEPDLTKDTELTPKELADFTAKGTDKRAILIGPRGRYVLFPKLRAYYPQPVPKEHGAEPAAVTQSAPAEVGKEIVDGHPCRKYELKRSHDGRDLAIAKWEADDLDGFPIQVEVREGDGGVTFLFREVDRTTPKVSLFEVPSTYRRYPDARQLFESIAKSKAKP